MKLVIGILAGIALGLTISAVAGADVERVKGWENGASVMSQSRLFRGGYAAGASDMLTVVINAIRNHPKVALVYFDEQARCLDERSGGSLVHFTDFAETLWRGRATQAASILLDQACK